MRCCSYNVRLIVFVMFGNFAKLDSPRRLVQFWQNFQSSLVLLIPNCTHNRMITYTYYFDVKHNKPARVFYHGFQTRENNVTHEVVYQATLLFSRICKARKTMKITRPLRPRVFITLSALQIRANNKVTR